MGRGQLQALCVCGEGLWGVHRAAGAVLDRAPDSRIGVMTLYLLYCYTVHIRLPSSCHSSNLASSTFPIYSSPPPFSFFLPQPTPSPSPMSYTCRLPFLSLLSYSSPLDLYVHLIPTPTSSHTPYPRSYSIPFPPPPSYSTGSPPLPGFTGHTCHLRNCPKGDARSVRHGYGVLEIQRVVCSTDVTSNVTFHLNIFGQRSNAIHGNMNLIEVTSCFVNNAVEREISDIS